jgi:hypothetical protein
VKPRSRTRLITSLPSWDNTEQHPYLIEHVSLAQFLGTKVGVPYNPGFFPPLAGLHDEH